MLTRLFAALFVFSLFFIAPVRAETIVVTTDDSSENLEDGLTSLLEALQQGNASPDETVLITFNIPDPNPETPAMDPIVIFLGSPLFVQRPMTIDGTTQPGYVPGTPIIQISQALPGAEPVETAPAGPQAISIKSFSNFVIEYMVEPPTVAARALARADGDGTVFRGLSITHSQDNGLFFVNGSGHVVESCFIGIEPDGDAAGNNNAGIFVGIDVEGIRIGTNLDGTNDVLERNVISSNGETGILVDGQDDILDAAPVNLAAVPLGNILIAGNYIGTGPDGISSRGNGDDAEGEGSGILSLGTSVSILNNLVADHDIGIWIDQGGAVIQGNVVGLDSAGNAEIGNDIGIYVEPFTAVLIGTDSDGANDAAERNVIAGNYVDIQAGLLEEIFFRAGLAANLPAAFGDPGDLTIAGNYIGTTLDGSAAAIPFDFDNEEGIDQTSGVLALDWPGTIFIRNNVIGGKFLGIEAYSSFDSEIAFQTVIQGNLIGLNATGDAAIPNIGGIVLVDTDAAIIGTDGDGENDAAERNVISGNILAGIVIDDEESVSTSPALPNLAAIELPELKRVSGNYIGTNAAGTEAIGNGFIEGAPALGLVGGILIYSTENIIIGTDGDGSAGDAAEGNVISGNSPFAILSLASFGGGQQVIAGNIIGLNAAGTAALANGFDFEEAEGPLGTASAILISNFSTRIGTNNDGVSDALRRQHHFRQHRQRHYDFRA